MQGATGSLLVEAERHGVLGRIWKRRSGKLRSEFPASIAVRWRRAAYRLAARNLASCDELLRAVRCLRHAGIRSIPLKGPALGMALTGSVCTRDYVDLDLLIDGADSVHALEVLCAEGYRIAHQVGVNGAVCDQVALSHPDGSMMLELQWDLGRSWNLHARAGERPFPFEDLWRRRLSVRIGGVGIAWGEALLEQAALGMRCSGCGGRVAGHGLGACVAAGGAVALCAAGLPHLSIDLRSAGCAGSGGRMAATPRGCTGTAHRQRHHAALG
jgi:hypothetical protein